MGDYHAAVCHTGQWKEDPKPQAVHGGAQCFISGRFGSLDCELSHLVNFHSQYYHPI